MKIFGKCDRCRRRRPFVRKRDFFHPATGRIRSQSELCGGCKRLIAGMIK